MQMLSQKCLGKCLRLGMRQKDSQDCHAFREDTQEHRIIIAY